jgi:hypothetical protein
MTCHEDLFFVVAWKIRLSSFPEEILGSSESFGSLEVPCKLVLQGGL